MDIETDIQIAECVLGVSEDLDRNRVYAEIKSCPEMSDRYSRWIEALDALMEDGSDDEGPEPPDVFAEIEARIDDCEADLPWAISA
ncbi:hypothetical protein [Leisingera caerulea]|uniref:hypothetical protein n=1 Tax=Leisingera caerulea TaxID=506591 RepID=UPI0004863920|nr:hypothetical protein [Leisingera caerulea]